jgi:hypothetical protein
MWISAALIIGVAFGVFLEWFVYTRCHRKHTKILTSINSSRDSIIRFVRSWMSVWEHSMPTSAYEELDLWLERNVEQLKLLSRVGEFNS